MNVVHLTEENYFGVFSEAERILRAGGLIVSPTDTVYGILGRADDGKTVKKIFKIKKRSDKEPLPVFVKDISTARKYAYIADVKARFLEKVWPGKVTIVFHHKEKLPQDLTGGKDTIGLRIPDHPFLLELLGKLDFPLAQTSANIAGKAPAKNIEDLKNYFSGQEKMLELVIDVGEIAGNASTVLGFTGDKPVILRTGLINKSDFDQMLNSMVW